MFVKKVLKRIFIFLLVAIFLTVSVFCCFNRSKDVKAEVVSATVLGVSALLAFLAAQGVSLSFNGMDQEGISSEVNTMLSGYESGGKTWDDFNDNSSNWVTALIGKDNTTKFVCLGYEFLNWASGLPDWLKTTFGLQIGASTPISTLSYVDFVSGSYPYLPLGGSMACDVARLSNFVPDKAGTYEVQVFDNYYVKVVVEEVFDQYHDTYPWNIVGYTSTDGVTYNPAFGGRGTPYFVCAFVIGSDYSGIRCYLTPDLGSYHVALNFYNLDVRFSTSTFDISSIGIEGSLVDGYQDLQDALDNDLTDQVGNPDAVGVIDVGDTVGLTADQIYADILQRILAGDLDIDGAGVEVYDDVPVAEEEKDAEEAPTTGEIEGNIVIVDGLEDFFPFCIPFDFIALLEQFNAEPEAPKFTVEIGFGGVFEEEEIEIDLSPFETAAEIFRILMIIGFAILLILKTRDLIRG